jgi:hypothetical protein
MQMQMVANLMKGLQDFFWHRLVRLQLRSANSDKYNNPLKPTAGAAA